MASWDKARGVLHDWISRWFDPDDLEIRQDRARPEGYQFTVLPIRPPSARNRPICQAIVSYSGYVIESEELREQLARSKKELEMLERVIPTALSDLFADEIGQVVSHLSQEALLNDYIYRAIYRILEDKKWYVDARKPDLNSKSIETVSRVLGFQVPDKELKTVYCLMHGVGAYKREKVVSEDTAEFVGQFYGYLRGTILELYGARNRGYRSFAAQIRPKYLKLFERGKDLQTVVKNIISSSATWTGYDTYDSMARMEPPRPIDQVFRVLESNRELESNPWGLHTLVLHLEHLASRDDFAKEQYKVSQLPELMEDGVYIALDDSLRGSKTRVMRVNSRHPGREGVDGYILYDVDGHLNELLYDCKSTGKQGYDLDIRERDKLGRQVRTMKSEKRMERLGAETFGLVLIAHDFTSGCIKMSEGLSSHISAAVFLLPTRILRKLNMIKRYLQLNAPRVLDEFSPRYLFKKPGLMTDDALRELVQGSIDACCQYDVDVNKEKEQHLKRIDEILSESAETPPLSGLGRPELREISRILAEIDGNPRRLLSEDLFDKAAEYLDVRSKKFAESRHAIGSILDDYSRSRVGQPVEDGTRRFLVNELVYLLFKAMLGGA
jgi:hypothetical protein